MNDFTYAWLVVASITLVFFLAQAAISVENPAGAVYLNDTSLLTRNFDKFGNVNQSNPYGELPDAGTGQTENDFTDEYRVTQSWLGSLVGNNYLGDVLDTPYNILKSMRLPDIIANAIGSFWWGLLILLSVAMILGKER